MDPLGWPVFLGAHLYVFALIAFVAWLTGCATMYQKCSYTTGGRLATYQVRATVIGTGETELITSDCAGFAYSTEDTGLSDNGKDALGTIAEGAAKGLVPSPITWQQWNTVEPVIRMNDACCMANTPECNRCVQEMFIEDHAILWQ